jgi:hypothetical protein
MDAEAKVVIGIILALMLVGSGWKLRDYQYEHRELKALNERIEFQTKALNILADNNAHLQDEKDDAVSALEAVRVQDPQTITKTIYKRVEVPSGATTIDCPVVTAGAEYLGLWNSAAQAFNAMSTTDRSDGAAEADGVHAPSDRGDFTH